jgi:hypothetical protein
MTRTAEQSIVFEPAFSAAVSDGNDVIGFPAWTKEPPSAPCGAIAGRRLRARPLAMRFHDVEATQLADALVALLDLLADVPGAASDFPLVHARIAAERPPRWFDEAAAPATDRLPSGVAFGLAPLLGGHDTGAPGAHEWGYRRMRRVALVGGEGGYVSSQTPTMSESAKRASSSIHWSRSAKPVSTPMRSI